MWGRYDITEIWCLKNSKTVLSYLNHIHNKKILTMSSQVKKKRRLNWTLLTISKFAFPEHIIKSLAQCNISLILCALHKLLQFILTRTPQTLLLWSRITLVWCCSHVLLIPSWLLWSTTMATKQGTTNSMTLKTQTRYVLYNYLLQYRSMFGCYGRRWDLSKRFMTTIRWAVQP